MKIFLQIVLLSILLISCDSNERNIKKTFNRLNSGETSAASKYIWPKDHKNLYTFEQRFLSKNDLLSFDIETIEKLNDESYKVTLNCSNGNEELLTYFKNKGNLVSGTKIEDTIYVDFKTLGCSAAGVANISIVCSPATVTESEKVGILLTRLN